MTILRDEVSEELELELECSGALELELECDIVTG
jgi:hypothetical protein